MFQRASSSVVVALALIGGDVACKSKPTTQDKPTSAASAASLGDLSTSLDAVRAEFNAHKREARFLTLLAPT